MDTVQYEFPDFLSEGYQESLLALAAHDREFFSKARPILKMEYFHGAAFRAICKGMHDFFSDHGTTPQEHELKDRVALMALSDAQREAWVEAVGRLYNNDEYELNRAEIQKHLTDFAVRCESATTVMKSAQELRSFDLTQLRSKLDEISRIPTLFGSPGMDVRKDYAKATIKDEREAFLTGYTDFDKAMRGGMRGGDLVYFLGPQKRGKSMVLINMGAGLMKMGHNVLHYSLEMYEIDVLKRYIACLTGVETNDLHNLVHLSTIEACMDELAKHTNATVVIREWPGYTLTNEDIANHYEITTNEYGAKFAIVCDYPALMRPSNPTGDSWTDLPSIAVGNRNIARKNDVPFIGAHQTTGDGLKIKRVDERHQAGAKALGTIVEYMWSIDQDDDDYQSDRFSMSNFLARHARKNETTYWYQQYEYARIKPLTAEQYADLRPKQEEGEEGLPSKRRAGGRA